MTEYLLHLLGPFFLLIGVSLLLNKSFYQAMMKDFEKNKALLFFSGFVIFVLGMLMVLAHNVWNTTLEIVVSLFSWLTLLKGVGYILVPEKMMKWSGAFKKSTRFFSIIGVIYTLLGAWLTWVAYLA